jgi:chloramphenicol-sensitive protein RarD
MVRNNSTSGIVFSLTASLLFSMLYYYVTWLTWLGSEKIYGWRILLTAVFLVMFVLVSGRYREIVVILQRLRSQPSLLILLPLSAFLLGIQLWLFMWAPINGHALDVSLGYFLLPLILVFTGRIFFQEKISAVQALSCAFALAGIGNALFHAGYLSWPTLLVALGYPVYLVLRRKLGTDNTGGFFIDILLSVPVGLWLITGPLPGIVTPPSMPAMVLFVVGLGLLSVTALGFMVIASQRLTMGLFGLLTYVEPMMLVIIAWLLGERIAADQWPTYIAIWLAVLVLIAEGALVYRRRAKSFSANEGN